MKTTFGGGSSTVFKRALNDDVESLCTSSMIKTRYRSRAGVMLMFSRMISRILSTCVFEAASNSRTSIERLSAISVHEGHGSGSVVLRGLMFGLSVLWQFNAFAKRRAVVVLPTPRAPANR